MKISLPLGKTFTTATRGYQGAISLLSGDEITYRKKKYKILGWAGPKWVRGRCYGIYNVELAS